MDIRIVVLGGGPGGYAAALHAARRGAQVTLVERDALGGTCLNRGCIPSKILKACADRLEAVRRAAEFGIGGVAAAGIDLAAVRARQQRIIDIQIRAIGSMLKEAGVRLVAGAGRIDGPGRLTVETDAGTTETLPWDRLILATGSRPAPLAGLPFDGQSVWSSNEALFPDRLPGHLLIVGGGVIGCELASIYRSLGSRVTLVEALDRLLPLPSVDPDVSTVLLREMKRRGIDCRLGARVCDARPDNAGITVELRKDREAACRITADRVLVCIGRRPTGDGVGLETVGIATDAGGWIQVDEGLATTAAGVFAIGDLLGPDHVMLAHVAGAEAAVAAENALAPGQHKRRMDYRAVPAAIFTAPEVAVVGSSETEAVRAGLDVRSTTVLFRSLGKAHAIGEIAGQAKIVFQPRDGRIRGVHLIGARATDLIAEATLAIQQGCTVRDLAATIHAHPTLAEIMGEAATRAVETLVHG